MNRMCYIPQGNRWKRAQIYINKKKEKPLERGFVKRTGYFFTDAAGAAEDALAVPGSHFSRTFGTVSFL